jgi:hypothetical protein
LLAPLGRSGAGVGDYRPRARADSDYWAAQEAAEVINAEYEYRYVSLGSGRMTSMVEVVVVEVVMMMVMMIMMLMMMIIIIIMFLLVTNRAPRRVAHELRPMAKGWSIDLKDENQNEKGSQWSWSNVASGGGSEAKARSRKAEWTEEDTPAQEGEEEEGDYD